MTYHDRQPNDGVWEQDGDLDNEAYIKSLLENRWQCRLIKQAKFDPVDFFAVKGDKTVAWVEMRRRSCESCTYPEIFMGREKFRKLRDACRILSILCLFVLRFTDRVMCLDLTCIERPKEVRASRGEMAVKRVTDDEVAVLLPVKQFRVI